MIIQDITDTASFPSKEELTKDITRVGNFLAQVHHPDEVEALQRLIIVLSSWKES